MLAEIDVPFCVCETEYIRNSLESRQLRSKSRMKSLNWPQKQIIIGWYEKTQASAFSVWVLKSLSLSFPQNLTKCTVSRVITVCVFQGLIAIVSQKEVSQQRFLVHNT